MKNLKFIYNKRQIKQVVNTIEKINHLLIGFEPVRCERTFKH